MSRLCRSIFPLRKSVLLCVATLTANSVISANQSSTPSEVKSEWNFDGTDLLGKWQGKGFKISAGPQAPSYPKFSANNQGVELDGKNAALVIPDAPHLRFAKGDSITMEAWVKVRKLKSGQFVYLIGKGRNRHPELGDENQNYSLRLKEVNGRAAINFLFTSERETGKPAKWHRWNSATSFKIDTGWHHVAITYTFGKKDSLRGYINGAAVKGTWDLEGPTDRGPVVDSDSVVIGSGFTRGSAETLDGWLDQVAIHRSALSAKVIAERYAAVPAPAPLVDQEKLVKGKVLVELCEQGMPDKSSWPITSPIPTESYHEEVFGFSELPHRYISTGVRADRAPVFLLRASAKVRIPKGNHRLLLRGLGSSRLFIDGKEILNTPFPVRGQGGFALLADQSKYLDLGPDFRFAPPGNYENTTNFVGEDKEHLVILESIVGGGTQGSHFRPDLGETVAAISLEGNTSWSLLSPGDRQVSYTDPGWNAYERERRAHFKKVNREARLEKRKEHEVYWSKRREDALQWLDSTPEISVPHLPANFPANNPIDHFIADRITSVEKNHREKPENGVDYFQEVHPILEAKCYACHQNSHGKGGLNLASRSAALHGGKSDGAAIVPGKPDESALLLRATDDPDNIMPPQGKGEPLNKEELAILERWIAEGAHWPELRYSTLKMTPLTEDLTFLRRIALDSVGVVPTEAEILEFQNDKSPERRKHAIHRYLNDPRWADRWMGYWQDVLAENPNILNPTLNNTGPFRWWIYESLQDNKPMDLFVTELIKMEGSTLFGGPAGFSVASQNDVPMAHKALVLSSAFLGVEMKCARCHDSPTNSTKQQDLFELAAMLARKPIELPSTSSVPLDRIHQTGREALIQITLKPGSKVEPKWSLGDLSSENDASRLVTNPQDSREKLAALLTVPQNTRFAEVLVNRMWQQLMGRGIIEPVEDWEKGQNSHPELLHWLGREFVRSGYDLKSIQRLIMNSHAYQRQVDSSLATQEALFVSPAPRRLAAEQIVDSLFAATGKPFQLEEMSLDIDGDRRAQESISLGNPHRSWMLASTSNERDRPSLVLPRIQAVVDVLEIFGWNGARVEPLSKREISPNVLQPAIISNGTVGGWLTQLSDDHALVHLALEKQSLDQLLDRVFLRLLTRKPTKEERDLYYSLLHEGYEQRSVASELLTKPVSLPREREKYVSWSNHVDADANTLREQHGLLARRGDPPTSKLHPQWRSRFEDVIWALINSPTWVSTP